MFNCFTDITQTAFSALDATFGYGEVAAVVGSRHSPRNMLSTGNIAETIVRLGASKCGCRTTGAPADYTVQTWTLLKAATAGQ